MRELAHMKALRSTGTIWDVRMERIVKASSPSATASRLSPKIPSGTRQLSGVTLGKPAGAKVPARLRCRGDVGPDGLLVLCSHRLALAVSE